MDDTIAYKCPCCGASLVWGSKEQELVCEYCDNKFTEAQLKEIADEENTKAQEMNAKWTMTMVWMALKYISASHAVER